ncbi:MAG: GNAT family N-acetyltransferase [Rhodospirillaceae bacterium]|nr:GNAT family N-acetyltransferase [Rhodospirillaceae bacterium]
MTSTITIRPPKASDKQAWLGHWQGYITFYESSVADDITEATWERLLEGKPNLFGFVACDENGAVIGFVHCVTHLGTWETGKDCYLEDLFVDPAVRGQGAGRKLIEAVIEKARNEGWRKVYWKTSKNNVTARTLYDRFTAVSDWVSYEIEI